MGYNPISMDDVEKELGQRIIELCEKHEEGTPEIFTFLGLASSYGLLKETSDADKIGEVLLLIFYSLGYEIRKPTKEA